MSSGRVGYRELKAACICRPHRSWFGSTKWLVPTHPLMVWSDDDYSVGDELSLDVFPGDGTTLEFLARVEWVEELASKDPAAFRVGLRVSSKHQSQRDQLERLLG